MLRAKSLSVFAVCLLILLSFPTRFLIARDMCAATLRASTSSSYFAFLSSLRAGRRRSISLNGVPHIASLVVGTENQRRHCSITSESGVIARSLAVASSCVAVFKGRDNLHLTSCQRRQPRSARPILPLLDANTGRMYTSKSSQPARWSFFDDADEKRHRH